MERVLSDLLVSTTLKTKQTWIEIIQLDSSTHDCANAWQTHGTLTNFVVVLTPHEAIITEIHCLHNLCIPVLFLTHHDLAQIGLHSIWDPKPQGQVNIDIWDWFDFQMHVSCLVVVDVMHYYNIVFVWGPWPLICTSKYTQNDGLVLCWKLGRSFPYTYSARNGGPDGTCWSSEFPIPRNLQKYLWFMITPNWHQTKVPKHIQWGQITYHKSRAPPRWDTHICGQCSRALTSSLPRCLLGARYDLSWDSCVIGLAFSAPRWKALTESQAQGPKE